MLQVADEKKATLALWTFAYEYEAGAGPDRIARAGDELRAKFALAGPSAMTFGAYLGEVGGEEDGIALVRVESASPSADGEQDEMVMIIDTVAISPRFAKEHRPVLESAVVKSLRAIGEMNQFVVRLWTDFDV